MYTPIDGFKMFKLFANLSMLYQRMNSSAHTKEYRQMKLSK
ncbi:hypothetical protein HMPREF0663_10613 [Hoylesella oralis ATCC 33269]|uniref:Uncharacterized protein n=1 Tax=Hoylesella oralis ATCC 33269 TaxID=873533 RepID=E7RNB3_9BACT|nr:hypothetical protein HMPREF0663_10613 [Hoylesella oralis ATCC 33269]